MNKGNLTLLFLGVAHSLNHSLFLVLPPLLSVVSRSLESSYQTLGFIMTLTFLIYGGGALIGGPLSDYLGSKNITKLSLILSGASTLIFLLPPNIITFSAGMLVMAFWASFYHPTSNSLISEIFPENTASAMGVHGAAGSIGQILTPTVAYFIGILVDWRLSFLLFGVLSLITGFFMGNILGSDSGKTSRRFTATRLKAFRRPIVLLILTYNIFIGLFFRGVDLFLPTYLNIISGLPGELAAFSSSMILLFGVLGQYIGGRASDKHSSQKVIFVFSVGMVASMMSILTLSNMGVSLFIVLFGLSYYGHQPAMTALLGSLTPKEASGTAFGLMFFFSFGLGSISAAIAGYFADVYNLKVSFVILSVFSILTLIVSLGIIKKLKKEPFHQIKFRTGL
ncbi:MFS transporter [Candidatus Bathyarchaeota archaeon]|nr:MFS transporter [Candidatus Bathyarchaeota archaeon]